MAIKVLQEELTQDPERKARFVQEARAAAGITHPNIVAVHDIDEADDGRTFIVMEYVRGRSLREILAEGALAPREATALALGIADGLAAAHENGIIHRDLKPENVLVAESGISIGRSRRSPGIQSSGDTTTKSTKAFESIRRGSICYSTSRRTRASTSCVSCTSE